MAIGRLSYQATACFSSNITDQQGHTFGGVPVKFSLKFTNSGQRSGYAWIGVIPDDSSVQLLYGQLSWSGQPASLGDNALAFPTPAIPAGGSRTLSWTIDFLTPFDVNYVVSVVRWTTPDSPPAPESFVLQANARWQLLTTETIC